MTGSLAFLESDDDHLLPNARLIADCEARFGLDIASVFLSAPPVGGDLWGLLPIDSSKLAIFCADVCGHGAEVAPHTRFVHALLRTPGLELADPPAVLAHLNRHLYTLLPLGRFVAIWYAVIDIKDDTLVWSSSTFLPQLLRPAEGRFELLTGEGLPLGFQPEVTFERYERAFQPDSRLVLYSDALTETPLPPDAVFSSQSLCDFVNGIPASRRASLVTKALIDQLDLGMNRLIDDLTLVTLFRHPKVS